MTNVPSWNTTDRPLLEAVRHLRSQGKPVDDKAVAEIIPSLTGEELRNGLGRLIESGHLTGGVITSWQATGPVRVVDLDITTAGLAALDD